MFCKAEAAVTHNLIGRKVISKLKGSVTCNSLPTVGLPFIRVTRLEKRHTFVFYFIYLFILIHFYWGGVGGVRGGEGGGVLLTD